MLVSSVTLTSEDGATIHALAGGFSPSGWAVAPHSADCLEGWWQAPAPRAQALARPQTDGAFAPASLLVGPRVVTLVLHHTARDEVDEREARELIARVCRQWLRLVVEEAGLTTHVRGYVSDMASLTHHDERTATWALVITCPDPLRYEGPGSDDPDLSGWRASEGVWSLDASGGLLFPAFDQTPTDLAIAGRTATALFTGGATTSLLVDNPGTSPTWPALEVVGPVGWAAWSLGEHRVEWRQAVPPGLVLRINTDDGAVTLGEARIDQSGLVADDFFQLPPGVSHVGIESDRPALMRVRWLPAWT